MANQRPKPPIGEQLVVGYPTASVVAPPSVFSCAVPPHPAANIFYVAPEAYHDGAAPSLCSALCHRILIAFAISFLLVWTISLLLWIFIHPQFPVFSVSSAAVSDFNLSSPSDAGPRFSSTFEITLSVSNPNKRMGIIYDHVSSTVAYGGFALARTTLPPFMQEEGNSTTLRATMAAAEYVGSVLATRISGERAKGGAVGFQVKAKASILYRRKGWMMDRSKIRVSCGDVRLVFANMTTTVGTMVKPQRDCQVNYI